jgi:PAS domain S-box-containing protein
MMPDSLTPEKIDALKSSILDDLPVIIAVHDLDHRIQWANKAYLKTLGKSLADIKGTRCNKAWGLSSLCKGCPVTEAIKKRCVAQAELFPGNQKHWPEEQGAWLVKAAPVEEGGRVAGAVEVAFNMTEQKRTEEALTEREREFRWILKSMLTPFVIFESVFDDSGRFVSYRFLYINEEYEKVTGVKKDEVKGRTVHEVWPGTEQEWIKRYGEVALTGRPQSFDLYHSPTEKLYNCNVFRPWDAKDRFCVIFEDITERRKKEKELKKRERLLNFAVKQMPVPVLIAETPDVRITRYNKAAIELLADIPPSISDVRLEDHRKYWPTFHPDGTPYKVEDLPLTRAIKEGKHIRNREIIVRHKDGDRWVSASAAPLLDDDGNIVAGIVVFPDITESKKAESELQKRESMLRIITENTKDLIALRTFEKEPRYIYVSPSYEPLTGYDCGELEGKRSLDYIHPEDREKMAGLIEVFFNTANIGTDGNHREGLHEKVEYRYRKKDGSWLEVEGLITRAGDKLVSVCRDISQRKRSERELRESEERFRKTVLNSPFPAMMHADDGEVLEISASWTDITGYEAGEIPTMADWVKKAYDRDADKVYSRIKRVYSIPVDGKKEEGEFTVRTKYGEERIWSFSSSAVGFMPDGRKLIISMAKDITSRKRVERDLEVAEERMKLVLKGADLGTWDWNIQTGELLFNERWADMLGYNTKELAPNFTTWEQLVHPDDISFVEQRLEKHFEGKSDFYEAEFRMRHISGQWIWVLGKGKLIERDKNGKPLRACGTNMDITSQKVSQQRIEHLNRVLMSIRGVNQLITREKDIRELLSGTALHLVKTGGYSSVLITLDTDDAAKSEYELFPGGLAEEYLSEIEKAIHKGVQINCRKTAKEKGGLVIVEDIKSSCPGCPLRERYEGKVILAAPLFTGEKAVGSITAALPEELAPVKEEQELFNELAGDITYALSGLKKAAEHEKLSKEREKHIRELEVFYKSAIGREERILELKEEISKLRKGRNKTRPDRGS